MTERRRGKEEERKAGGRRVGLRSVLGQDAPLKYNAPHGEESRDITRIKRNASTHLHIVAQLLAFFLSSYEVASIVAMINPAAKVDRARKTKEGCNSSQLVV